MPLDPRLKVFSGVVPLFPLPKVVLFPGTRIPLHIFEPRYRQMVIDAESKDRLIAMVLPKKGDDGDPGDRELHEVACLGQMQRLQRLQDGRFLMQLAGLQRVRIRREVKGGTPFRLAFVDLMPDYLNPLEGIQGSAMVEEVIEAFNVLLKRLAELPGSIVNTKKDASPGLLLDVMSYYLPSDAYLKQKLLEEIDVFKRGRLLLAILRELSLALPGQAPAKLRLFPKPCRN
jgi:Lon protease-like protein